MINRDLNCGCQSIVDGKSAALYSMINRDLDRRCQSVVVSELLSRYPGS
jgi:hypothetical protein